MKINQKFDIDADTASYQYIPPVQRNYTQPAVNNSRMLNKEQHLEELRRQNLPYAEYQKRYQQIMNQ